LFVAAQQGSLPLEAQPLSVYERCGMQPLRLMQGGSVRLFRPRQMPGNAK
jgi:hypothetical protein